MKSGICPKCGSTDVLADVMVRDDGRNGSHPLRVVVEEPEPLTHGVIWVQGQAVGEVHAWICAACGFTELYTDSLPGLLEAYRKGHPSA